MFRKIAVKTILFFLLISLAPIFILSYIFLQKTEDALKKSIISGFEALAVEKAQSIRHHLEDHQIEAQALVCHPEVKEAIRQANLSNPDLEHILRLDKEWTSSQGHSPDADRIMNSPLSVFLREYQNSNKYSYGEIFVTDAKGATVAMTGILSDYYQADEDWCINGYAQGKGLSLFDDEGYDQSVGAPVIGVVVPVRDNGNVIGILKINYLVGDVLEIVERTKMGNSDLVFLARPSGTLAAMSKSRNYKLTDLEKGLLKEKKSGVAQDLHKEQKTLMAYAPVETPILTQAKQSPPVEKIAGEKWEPGNWTLFIEMDQQEAFFPIAKLKETIRIALLLAILIVFLLALFFSGRITKPLRELMKGALILGGGDLSHHVYLRSKDEIGELAGAFNKMADSLKTITASRKELEKEVMERKGLEEELRKSGERYRAMIEAMSNCVAVFKAAEDGKDFIFLEFNRAAEKTDKAKAKEIIGKKVTEAFPGVREFGLLDVFQRVYRTGKAEHFPATLYKDSRIEGWRDNFVYKLPSGEVVAVYEDVTEKKKAEESERQNREKLAHLDRLKSLGTMVSGIGHEINNPNNFILMNTTLLREIWDDAKKILASCCEKNSANTKLGGLPFDKAMETFPQLIDDMRQGSVRIQAIVSNLRDFAVKDQAMLMETVNVRDVILSSESLTRNLIQKNTMRFSIDIGDIPMVLGNFQKLEQVMVNLITNACHSLTDPGQAIEIKAFYDKDKDKVFVVVRDEGVGMDQETLKRAMEPFFTTKQHLGGTGLGTSISYGIIKEHGGEMEYASEPGKGTTVTVEIPVV